MTNASDIWSQFCYDLEQAGATVLKSDLAGSKTDKAEGLRYLTRLLRVGLDMNLENADPAFPSFYQASHKTAKIGSDNPDNYYQNATISGDHTYRIWGHRGSVPILSFGTKANRYAIDGTMASTGEIDIREVKTEADGSFEIFVSQKKQGENWLPTEADSSILIVRQTFIDRNFEIAAIVNIECIDSPENPPLLTYNAIDQALKTVPAFVAGTASTFIHWAELFRKENRNSLNTVDQSMFFKAGGDPMIYYLHGWWELSEDEYLQIDTGVPNCETWNFQINNVWMESLDYRYHTIHTNKALANYNLDGSVTVCVGANRPPVAKNWIDTAGHNHGTMLWRWTGAREHPIPNVQILKMEKA